MKTTQYALYHRITGKLVPTLHLFQSATEGGLFAILHDLHVNVLPCPAGTPIMNGGFFDPKVVAWRKTGGEE